MPIQALSFVYVRALAATTATRSELKGLCEAANVTPEDVVIETRSSPDLYASVLTGDEDANPYPATNAVAAALRKSESFKRLVSAKMSLGSDGVRELGNLYTASLPAWIASGFAEAVAKGEDLSGKTMALVGYGSGDAAESIPIHVTRGFEQAARRIEFEKALAGAVDLTREQYEALHDGHPLNGSAPAMPRRGFAITGVGDRYDPAFQDLCVEYYDYVA
jgi:hydroxymethylglutaryl-CoA synthase